MKYGFEYRTCQLNEQSMNIVRRAIDSTRLKWESGGVDGPSANVRVSEISWIYDARLKKLLMDMCASINKDNMWNVSITGVEDIQFGIYPEGGKYEWHMDQHRHPVEWNGQRIVRKISMSLFMSDLDEYEGGEFDLELYKPGVDPRYETFRLPKGSAIFFLSDYWHRVRPVTSGVRKSLVAWFYGPPYV